ncbi:MAG TPA: TspO/MBR family protein [Methanocella sp.]|nr:TspO/MBR family protein [Methanocella sp.]
MLLSVLAAIVSFVPIVFARGLDWYEQLNRPAFAPPGWLLGPAWALVFLLMAIALYLAWQKWPAKEAKMGISLYLTQLLLCVVWVYLLFGLQDSTGMLFALAESVVLLAMLALTIERFYQLDRRAAYLLVPCLLWVAYLAVLTAALWQMNPGA